MLKRHIDIKGSFIVIKLILKRMLNVIDGDIMSFLIKQCIISIYHRDRLYSFYVIVMFDFIL